MVEPKTFLVVIVDETAGSAQTFRVIGKLDQENNNKMLERLNRAFNLIADQFLRGIAKEQ